MISAADFSVATITATHVSVVFVPTGQTFEFNSIVGLGLTGAPTVNGPETRHPPWLMVRLARQVATDAANAMERCKHRPEPPRPGPG